MGNLSSIKGNGIDQSFTYNGNGDRMSKTDSGKTITYVNDINTAYTQVLQTYDENNQVINTYDYGIERIRSRGETDETYLYDATGNVVGSLNPKDEMVSYAYTAFGDLMPKSPQPTTFGYNGEDTDYTTGLQYLRARYYDVTTGRFIQRDEYRGDKEQPITLNRYAYAGNNPIMFSDPSGYISFGSVWSSVKSTATNIVSAVKSAAKSIASAVTTTYDKIKTSVKNAFTPQPTTSSMSSFRQAEEASYGGDDDGEYTPLPGPSSGPSPTPTPIPNYEPMPGPSPSYDSAKDMDGDGAISPDEVVASEFGGQLCSENEGVTFGEYLEQIFGGGSSSIIKVSKSEKLMMDAFLINIKVGTSITSEVSSNGDSSKPISVYAKGVTNAALTSSAGLKINIADKIVNLSFGIDDVGVSYYKKVENGTDIYKVSLSLNQAKFSTLVGNSIVADDINEITGNPEVVTNYEETSVDLLNAAMVYLSLYGIQNVGVPTGIPNPVPIPVPVY